jgi:two-component system nitrate/nitrite response regulator NarL
VSDSPLRVLLVEDHELTRRGLVEILNDSGFRIAGEAASLAVARSLLPRLDVDIVLIDVYLRDGDGIELAADVKEHDAELKVVMLTGSDKPGDLFRALRAGADGYLTKDIATERLGDTLRAVARGEAPLSRQMTAMLVREFRRLGSNRRNRTVNIRARLTMREWEILSLLADGKRTSEIAADLVISLETVRSHIKSILRKLDVHTRAAAVACLDEMREVMELAAV